MKAKNPASTIPTFFPDDHELLETQSEAGEISYSHPAGYPVSVYHESLEELIELELLKFEKITDRLLGEDDGAQYDFVFEALIRQAKSQFYEIFRVLEREIGPITCTLICKDQHPYRSDRVVSVSVIEKEANHA